MTAFAPQIAAAQQAIAANGAKCTWTVNNEVQNEEQPWETEAGGTPTTYSVVIVLLPGTGGPMSAFTHLMQNSSVPEGALTGLMAAVPFVPAINDQVTTPDGVVHNVKDIDVLQPDGTPILYTITFAN